MKAYLGPLALLCAITSSAPSVLAAIVPYNNTFNSSADVSDWTTLGTIATPSWTVVGGGFYEGSGTGGSGGNFASLVPLTNFSNSGLSGFTASTSFKVTDANSNETIGLVAMSSSDLKNTLVADVSGAGLMRIGYFNNGAFTSLTLISSGDATTALNTNKIWSINLDGTYQANGDLSLSYVLTDGIITATRTTTVSSTIVSTILTGNHFGFRLNTTNANNLLAVQFDSLSVTTTAIPEPSTYALLAGFAVFGVIGLRRSGRSS